MSAEQNKATLRRFVEEVWNKGNLAVAGEIVSPGLVMYILPPGTPPGLEPFKRLFAQVRAAFPDVHITIEDLVAEGDQVAARLVMTGTHLGPYFTDATGPLPPTGKRFTMKGIDIWRFDEEGKWVECWSIYDRLAQLQQLGAIPVTEPTHN